MNDHSLASQIAIRSRGLGARHAGQIRSIPKPHAVADPSRGAQSARPYRLEVAPKSPRPGDALLTRSGDAGISALCGIMSAHGQLAYASIAGRDQLPITDRLSDRPLTVP